MSKTKLSQSLQSTSVKAVKPVNTTYNNNKTNKFNTVTLHFRTSVQAIKPVIDIIVAVADSVLKKKTQRTQ